MDGVKHSIRDLALGNLSPEDSLRVLEMVERDPELSRELELATALVNVSAQEGKDLFGEQVSLQIHRPKWTSVLHRMLSGLRPTGALRFLGYGLAVLFLIVAGLSQLSRITTSPYASLAAPGESVGMERLRATGEQELILVHRLSVSGNHEEVIELLERYLRHHPGKELTGYVRLALGENYLRSARKTTLMLFPRYDTSKVERAIHRLAQVITSGGNDRLVEEAYWLRAKASLMLEHPDSAISDLNNILLLKGRRSSQAAELLREIVRITSTE